jgi:hypothetical protein
MQQQKRIVRILLITTLILLLAGCGSIPAASTPRVTISLVDTVPPEPTSGVIVSTAMPGPTLGSLPTIGPAVSPAPVTARPDGETVTLEDQGQTLILPVGQRFTLFLGEGYTWTVTVADERIVSRVGRGPTAPGEQGQYEAFRPGQTRLEASGDPLCRHVRPPCGMPSRAFWIDILVP